MAQSKVLRGADIKLYVAGKLYPVAISINYTIDYGEHEIYGIDSQFPQEIASTRMSVKGTVSGVRAKLSGGLQGFNLRTRINEILHSPYTSLRLVDRHSNEDLLWLPQMKVSSETFSVQAKGIVNINFSFTGIIPYQPIDMSG